MITTPVNPAVAYQEYFGPAIFEPLARHVVDLATPAPAARVLDVACGTGIVTRAVAWISGPTNRVVGVDRSPAMIDVARSLPSPAGVGIEWQIGDATALDLPNGSFDLVMCQQGLQFFPDRAAGAGEMRRVLANGGRAVIAVWQGLDVHPLYSDLADVEAPRLAEFGVNITRDDLTAPFSFGASEDLRELLAGAGFRHVEMVTRSIQARFPDADNFVERMELAYAAVVPQFVADPAAFREYVNVIGRDASALVEGYREDDHIVVPMHTNIAVAFA